MAVRRGPTHAITTPILTPLVAGIADMVVQSAYSIDQSLVQFSTSFLNSFNSFSSGGATTTGAYGTGGGQYYFYKLLDLVGGLF